MQPNYEKATDSVKINIDTEDGRSIAYIQQGVTFTPFRGVVKVSTDAAHKTVQELTDVMFEIIPEHAIYSSDSPQIDVEFPAEIQISSTQCEIKDVYLTGVIDPIPATCTRFQQSFTIKGFLPEDYDYIPSEGTSIKFTVG